MCKNITEKHERTCPTCESTNVVAIYGERERNDCHCRNCASEWQSAERRREAN